MKKKEEYPLSRKYIKICTSDTEVSLFQSFCLIEFFFPRFHLANAIILRLSFAHMNGSE